MKKMVFLLLAFLLHAVFACDACEHGKTHNQPQLKRKAASSAIGDRDLLMQRLRREQKELDRRIKKFFEQAEQRTKQAALADALSKATLDDDHES